MLGLNLSDESVQSELVLYETDGDNVRVIVDFCYTGHINLTEKNAETFLSIAQSFEFDLLERECLRFYAGQLSVNNFEDTLLIADKFNNAELREHVINFLCECFESVSLTDVQRLGFSSLHRLLECEKIQATEELIFKRVMEWFQKDQADRRKYMNQLLKLIRLQHVAQEVGFADMFSIEFSHFIFFIGSIWRIRLTRHTKHSIALNSFWTNIKDVRRINA